MFLTVGLIGVIMFHSMNLSRRQLSKISYLAKKSNSHHEMQVRDSIFDGEAG